MKEKKKTRHSGQKTSVGLLLFLLLSLPATASLDPAILSSSISRLVSNLVVAVACLPRLDVSRLLTYRAPLLLLLSLSTL